MTCCLSPAIVDPIDTHALFLTEAAVLWCSSARFKGSLSLLEGRRRLKATAPLKPYLQSCRLAVLQTKRQIVSMLPPRVGPCVSRALADAGSPDLFFTAQHGANRPDRGCIVDASLSGVLVNDAPTLTARVSTRCTI